MHLSFTNSSALWLLILFLPLLALPLIRQWFTPSASRLRVSRRTLYGVFLRLLVGLGLILSLAGVQWVQPVDDLTVVFALDLSDSVPVEERARAERFIREAAAEMPPGARAAVIAFGEEALVERLASEARDLPPIASVPGASRTDIASALRLALALFPEDSQKRLILLSDGLENVGEALARSDWLASRGVEIDIVPLLAPPVEAEAYLADLEVPAAVREGQSFAVTALIESTVAQRATVRLFDAGDLVVSRQLELEPGMNRMELRVTAEKSGFHRYRAELAPAADTLPQNNLASGFTQVYGPPRVLIVAGSITSAGTSGEADVVRRALASTRVNVDMIVPAALPGDLATLSNYDTVVLVNVPARAIPEGAMKALPLYVRELGRGLVMIGGENAYGAGGYLRTPLEAALPVDMDVRSRTKEPNLALVLAVDKSGSMGRCHCDDPDARPGEYEPIESGLPKVDIAKDAIMMASEALGHLDYLGVLGFNENAHWLYDLQPVDDVVTLQYAIGSMQAEGQTNIFAGLDQAESALIQTSARVKHIVLVTDGWSNSGEYDALTTRLADEGITLSVIAAGEGSPAYLEGLALAGGGRYYPVPSIHDLPDLFFQETVEAVGRYLIEEAFYPLPAGTTDILRGIDAMALPVLLGYNGTTPKATAQVALISPRGDPVLAQWQYGLGRAVAWTSDLKGQWATAWVDWDRFNTFVAQMVGWTLPDPGDEDLETTLRVDGADVRIAVDTTYDAASQSGVKHLAETYATLIGPDMLSDTVKLEQVAAGRYEGDTSVSEPGTYMVQVIQRDAQEEPVAQRTTGLVIPYSPEYRRTGDGQTLLNELARVTGGETLTASMNAFAPTQVPASRATPMWPVLLLIAALLFPIDVAVRRLRLTPSDWAHLRAWMREHMDILKRHTTKQSAAPVLGELFEAKSRAQRRTTGSHPRVRQSTEPTAPSPSPAVDPQDLTPSVPQPTTSSSPITEGADAKTKSDTDAEDPLARLRAARDRARNRR
jgi:Mg-chelatase subunit ChlD